MDANSALVFDKTAINDLMRTVVGRLRKQKITISDIVNQLNANGVIISHAKFNDWFMTRPERDTTAPIAVFNQLFNVLFTFNPQIMTASELFSLLIASRIPINVIHAYAHYVPNNEWNKMLELHGIHNTVWDDAIIGQDAVMQQLFMELLANKCQILVGEPGVGKTAIAVALLRQYQMHKGSPVIQINLDQVRSFSQLQKRMLAQFDILNNDYQPQTKQIDNYIVRHKPIILFDGFAESEYFTVTQWLKYMQANFMPFMWLITSQNPIEVSMSSTIQPKTIAPLVFDKIDSPGWILAKRCLFRNSMFAPTRELLQFITQNTFGNPRAIRLMADYLQTTNFVVSLPFNVNMLVHLDHTAHTILELATLLQVPLSEQFMGIIAPAICEIPLAKVEEYVKMLKNKGYLISIDNPLGEYLLVQRVVLSQIMTTLSPVKRIHYLQLIFHILCNGLTIDMKFPLNRLYFRGDLPIVLQLATLMLQAGMIDDCALLCCLCSHIAIEVGNTADIIEIMEQCARILPSQSSTYSEIQLGLGKLYSERGLTPNAIHCFTQVRASELLRTNDYFRARVAVIQALGYVVRDVNLQQSNFEFLCHELALAIDYFLVQQHIEWQGRANHCLAYLHLFAGHVKLAHQHAAIALHLISSINTPSSVNDFYADVLRSHAMTLSLMGDHLLARNQLKQALVEYQQTFRIIEVLQTYMRLALNELFVRDIQAATNYFYIIIQEMHKSGNAKSVLYCIDIYTVLLVLQKKIGYARQLFQLCNRFREERAISRGIVFDQLIAQIIAQSADEPALELQQTPLFAANQTLASVLMFIEAEVDSSINN